MPQPASADLVLQDIPPPLCTTVLEVPKGYRQLCPSKNPMSQHVTHLSWPAYFSSASSAAYSCGLLALSPSWLRATMRPSTRRLHLPQPHHACSAWCGTTQPTCPCWPTAFRSRATPPPYSNNCLNLLRQLPSPSMWLKNKKVCHSLVLSRVFQQPLQCCIQLWVAGLEA